MWESIKVVFRWVYDWVTVLAAALVGAPSIIIQILSFVGVDDIAPMVGADNALKIVTSVAIAKALLAYLESRMKKEN